MNRYVAAFGDHGAPLVAFDNSKNCHCGGYYTPCYAARCTLCREVVTKHDFSAEDALQSARGHVCRAVDAGGLSC